MNVCKLVLDVAFSLGVILATQIQALPESAAAGTHHTAEGFRRRTEAYHGHNKTAGKRSAVSFFEDAAKLEVLEVANGASTNVGDVLVSTLQPYVDQGGTAYNYHPTEDEVVKGRCTCVQGATAVVPCHCVPWGRCRVARGVWVGVVQSASDCAVCCVHGVPRTGCVSKCGEEGSGGEGPSGAAVPSQASRGSGQLPGRVYSVL